MRSALHARLSYSFLLQVRDAKTSSALSMRCGCLGPPEADNLIGALQLIRSYSEQMNHSKLKADSRE
jgi:hypothetical protein